MKVAMSRQDVDHDGLELPDVRALQLFYRWDTSIKACTAAAFGHSYSFINLENLDKERAPQPGITPHHLWLVSNKWLVVNSKVIDSWNYIKCSCHMVVDLWYTRASSLQSHAAIVSNIAIAMSV
eukprot:1158916-Pelagomonas_calceolata.AAC.19